MGSMPASVPKSGLSTCAGCSMSGWVWSRPGSVTEAQPVNNAMLKTIAKSLWVKDFIIVESVLEIKREYVKNEGLKLFGTIINGVHAGFGAEVGVVNLRRLLDVGLGLVEAGVGNRGTAGEQCDAEDDSEEFVGKRFHN